MRVRWLVAAVLLAIPGGSLRAAAPTSLALAYDVTWSGMDVAHVEFGLTADNTSYRIGYRARSAGFLGWLRPFASEGTSTGRLDGNGASPTRFAVSSHGERASAWSVEFDASGAASHIEVPPQDATEREPVAAELRTGPDPLALALTALAGAEPGQRRVARSFDGRRVLDLELACADAVDVDGLLACEVQGRVLAGARRAGDDDRSAAPPPPVRVWLGRETRAVGWWPVRAEAESRWGRVTALLVAAGAGPEGALATDGRAPH